MNNQDANSPFLTKNRSKSKSTKSTKSSYKDNSDKNEFTVDQIDELFEAFSLFDKDYNGGVNVKEMRKIMGSVGLNATLSEIVEMFNVIDCDPNNDEETVEGSSKNTESLSSLNEDRLIDFPEFLSFIARKTVDIDVDKDAKEIFSIFNKDGTEKINSDDLIDLLNEVGEPLEQSDLENIDELFEKSSLEANTLKNGKPAITLDGRLFYLVFFRMDL